MTIHAPSLASVPFDGWIKTSWRTASRYYVAEIVQDLWGNWLLRRSWGGLGSRRGSSKTLPAESYEEALLLLADTAKRRQKRGYVLDIPEVNPSHKIAC